MTTLFAKLSIPIYIVVARTIVVHWLDENDNPSRLKSVLSVDWIDDKDEGNEELMSMNYITWAAHYQGS